MTTYTEFNKDMFLCNNFDNSNNDLYYKGSTSTTLSTPNRLSKAIFYNLTKIKTDLKDNDKDRQKIIDCIDPDPRYSFPPYDISLTLYNYLKTNQKTYTEYQQDPNNDWVYTFGQLVHYDISATLVKNDNIEKITTYSQFK